MDALNFVERDGLKFYCFSDSCNALFPQTPKSTVRNWLKTLGIEISICSVEERAHFRDNNTSLSSRFGLISHEDLVRVVDFESNKSPRKKLKLDTTASSSTSECKPVSSDPSNPTEIAGSDSEEFQDVLKSKTTAMSNESASNSPIAMGKMLNNSLVVYSVSSDEEEKTNGEGGEVNSSNLPENISQNTRKRRVLSFEEAPPALQTEIRSLRTFYTKPLNPSRTVEPFATVTIEKLIERIMGFMFFCSCVKNMSNLSLQLVSDVTLFTSFIEYLRDERKLMPSTLSNYLAAAVNIVKYNIVLQGQHADPDKSHQVRTYRQFIRQFQREAYRLAKGKKEGLCSTSNQRFYFVHVLETLRKLRDRYLESSGLAKSRFLHDFVMLALYIRANPGRSKEIRTLRLYLESEKQKPFNFDDFKTGNFIVFEQGLVYLVQSEFKNAKSSGPTRTDITEDEELVYYLNLYLRVRPSLMLGRSHDFFFLNASGQEFCSSSSIAKYIGAIFDREVSMKVSTNALRHALVTHFCSNVNDSGDLSLRRSLASLMKHSMRYQELVYNDQSHDEKTQASRHILRTQVTPNIFGEQDFVEPKDNATIIKNNPADELTITPHVGDIVALLDKVSTKNNIHFFLAKVARFNHDRTEAHLSQLERIPDSDNMYVLKPNTVWIESVGSLIFPIDIVYNSSKQVYELRTSSEQIYKCVHK